MGALGHALSPHEIGILLSDLGVPAPAGAARQQPGAAASSSTRTRTQTDEDFALLSARLDDLEALLGKLGTPKSTQRPQPPPPAASPRAAADPGALSDKQRTRCACGAHQLQLSFRRDEVPQLRAYAAGVWPPPSSRDGGATACCCCAGTGCCKGRNSNEGGGTAAPALRAMDPGRLGQGRVKQWRNDPVARYQ